MGETAEKEPDACKKAAKALKPDVSEMCETASSFIHYVSYSLFYLLCVDSLSLCID